MKRKRENAEIEALAHAKSPKPNKNSAESAKTHLTNLGLGINTAISKMDTRLLADYVAQRTKRFGDDLSVVELEDLYIPGKPSPIHLVATEGRCVLSGPC